MTLRLPNTVPDPAVQQNFDFLAQQWPISGEVIVRETIRKEQIEKGSLTGDLLVSGTITADKLDVDKLSAISADLGTVTAGLLEAVKVKGATIEGTTVKGSTVEGGTVKGTLVEGATIEGGTVKGVTVEGTTVKGGTIEGATLTAGEIVGATIKTATSGGRVEMDPAGIVGYNAANVAKFVFDAATGIAAVTGVISSEDGSEIPTKHLAGQIKETQIEEGSISTPLLAANAVTAAKISVANLAAINANAGKLTAGEIQAGALSVSTLSAISANLGTITAGTITGATFRTSATNPKVIMDSAGFRIEEASLTPFSVTAASGVVLVSGSGESFGNERQKITWNTSGGKLVGEIATSFSENAEAPYGRIKISAQRPKSPIYLAYLELKEASYEVAEETHGKVVAGVGGNSVVIINSNGGSSFPQLAALANVRMNFGKTKIETGAEANGWYATVTHGLGRKPIMVVANDATGTFQRIVSTHEFTTTTFKAGVYRADGAKSKSAEINWIAIG